MNLRTLLCLAALLATSACASITAGTTQAVAVNTAPKDGAECQLTNEKGSWTVPKTPGSTTVTKAYGELAVTCKHPDGHKGSTTMQSTTAGAAFGNIIAGGIIGAAVDMGSGAAYTYPSSVLVALSPPSDTAPLPVPTAGPTPAAVSQRMTKDDVEKKLKELSDLRGKKLIREAEYHEQVRAVLERM